jgi:signal transduction histidine kinase
MSQSTGSLGSRSWAWLGRVPAWTWDVAPAAILGALLALSQLHGYQEDEPALLLDLAAVAALLARRRAPCLVFAGIGAAAFVSLSFHYPAYPEACLAALVALYTVDTRCSRRWSLAASSVALIGASAAIDIWQESRGMALGDNAIAPAALILVLWVICDNVRVRRAYVAGLEERAAWVDAQRVAEAQRAAAEERARIARELHDVVAHHVAVMGVQAGAARMLNATIGEQTHDLLGSIESEAHQAMRELRRLLGVLRREDGAPPGDPQRAAAPHPGLGQLDRLIDQVRQAGLPVELTVVGTLGQLPDWVDLSAYRIVQEALTNVLKHAGPARTAVCLRCDRSSVTLIVTNDAPAPGLVPPQDSPGHGLIGMRERVAMAAGKFRAGPTAAGGFEVFARLPLDARPAPALQSQLTGGPS